MKSKLTKKSIIIFTVLGLLVSTSSVLAVQTFRDVGELPNGRTFSLPEAAGNSSVIYLGNAIDPASGKKVEGYAIVHYAKGGNKGKPDKGDDGGSSCYTYLAKGAKWKTYENYLVDPSNGRGLDEVSVRAIIANGISKWEDAADGTVDDGHSENIFEGEVSGIVDRDPIEVREMNGQNEVIFDSISIPNAIAVTIVWGYFSGPPFARELVEWDQIYDDEDFDWSLNGEAGKMDFDNIATHELGHSFGLGDLYESRCSEETMYGYGALGETEKQSLEAGDITGIDKLY